MPKMVNGFVGILVFLTLLGMLETKLSFDTIPYTIHKSFLGTNFCPARIKPKTPNALHLVF